jgi:DNA-binding NarL/FixJ family response regulator
LTVGTADDERLGRSLLRDAEQIAGRLGMAALARDVSVSLHGTDERAVYPDDLTAREVEVLRLVAIGRSNKDISTVLAISLNTVATHVRSILNKTHCANRTEAAAYAIRCGLHEQPREARQATTDGS